MKTHVKACVVGGGAVGTGIAYHLAKAGWQDVVLLECRIRMENEVFNESGQLICTGYTVHCFMSRETRKPVRCPDSLMELLDKFGDL